MLRRSRVAASLATLIALITIVAHNAATYQSIEPVNPNATQGTIEYGWPVTCFEGSIDVERMFYTTGPRQHWGATTDGSPVWVGLLSNVIIALLLAYTTYASIAWTLNSFTAKLTIATLIGLLTFAAFLFAFEVADNADHYEMFPRLRELFVETHVFEYIEKTVWLTIFVVCLWIPNRAAQLFRQRKNG